MPDVLVVVETMFGNTLALGRTIADALAQDSGADVALLRVEDAPPSIPGDVRLLVVGAPTHVRGLSRPTTRQQAVQQGAQLADPDRGMREWLTALAAPQHQVAAAAFDTRSNPSWVTGSAAAGALRRLHALGLRTQRNGASFFVTRTTGPLADGQLAAAESWGHLLAGWWQSVVAA